LNHAEGDQAPNFAEVDAVSGSEQESVPESWKAYVVKMEWFCFNETGELISKYSNEMANLEMLIQEQPIAIGKSKNVYRVCPPLLSLHCHGLTVTFQVNCAPYGNESSFVAKQVNLPGEWWFPHSNASAALWEECSELSDFHFTLRDFKFRAANVNCPLFGESDHSGDSRTSQSFAQRFFIAIDYSEPYLFTARRTREDISWIVQPLYAGKSFQYGISFPEDSFYLPNAELQCQFTLDAFSHYTYTESNRMHVYSDFQGV
jgi:hypothetical protein